MKIALASDHAGFLLKEQIKEHLTHTGREVVDFGTDSEESCDYPAFAVRAAKSVSENETDFGVIICGTGIGMSMVSNKIKGIRAANCLTIDMAKLTRQHNNANVLNLGARLLDTKYAIEILEIFLNTEFDGGRHDIRVNQIHDLTGL
jgi:ribose 5-phosphate isomerase B